MIYYCGKHCGPRQNALNRAQYFREFKTSIHLSQKCQRQVSLCTANRLDNIPRDKRSGSRYALESLQNFRTELPMS